MSLVALIRVRLGPGRPVDGGLTSGRRPVTCLRRAERSVRRRGIGLASFALLAGLSPAACGELVDDAFRPSALGILRGTIRAEVGATAPAEMALSVLWVPAALLSNPADPLGIFPWLGTPECDGRSPAATSTTARVEYGRWSPQAVSFRAVFPVQYEVEISRLPPPEGFLDLSEVGGRGRLSAGFLVMFEDVDGSQSFETGVDRYLGSTLAPERQDLVVFFEGELGALADAFSSVRGALPLGLSLVRGFRGEDAEIQPISTPLDLILPAAPEPFSRLLFECPALRRTDVTGGNPVPESTFRCSDDGRVFASFASREDGPCAYWTQTSGGCIDDTASFPPGWPCP